MLIQGEAPFMSVVAQKTPEKKCLLNMQNVLLVSLTTSLAMQTTMQ